MQIYKNIMKTYRVDELIKAAVKMGCNPVEASRTIKKTYEYYVKYRSDYNLKRAARYCMYIAPCK